MDISDPKFCYVLDGILLLYVIFITVLYLRAKFTDPSPGSKESSIYPMNKTGDPYSQLELNSMESSNTHRAQRRTDDVYMPLKSGSTDTYREIRVKEPRSKEFVYQDLRKATKDTYDSLQMQPLTPRR
ncbi:T-cell surface glycoprotein CD3 zeta chain-like [Arapaima gigas]